MYAACTTLPTDPETARAIDAEVLTAGQPEGLVAHVAGEVAEGWRIIDVWESEQHWQRFLAGPLAAAVERVTGQPPQGPDGPSTVLAVHSDAVRHGKVVLAPARL
jgi:hypothetical protein